MPTGYTAYIEDGRITTYNDFLMLCARAFGACISLRDEPLSKPIPEAFEFEGDFYTRMLQSEMENLDRYKNMTEKEAQRVIDDEYEKESSRKKKAKEEALQLTERYRSILNDLYRWEPPTEEHSGLKKFAIDQINMCLPDMKYYDDINPAPKMKPREWLDFNIQHSIDNITRYKKEIKEEKDRVDGRNKWLNQLRESLTS